MILGTGAQKRFEAKIDRNGPVPAHCPELGPCHVWLASRIHDGYGRFKLGGRTLRAHRVSFFLAHGRWPEPECCHRCDNPPCVNAEHLVEGTTPENIADKVAKGRQARGEQNGRAKLTDQLVRDMRAEYARGGVTRLELAMRFGVHPATIGRIVRGKNWTP